MRRGTVIAYRDGVLASDSRINDGHGMHFGSGRKIYRLKNGALVGAAGDCDARDVLSLFAKATPRKMPSRAELANTKCDGQYIVVFPKGHVYAVDIGYIERDGDGEWGAAVDLVTDQFVAIGHGYQFAYGALESGKSAIEAVRIACKRDTTCSLPIQWESINKKGNSDDVDKGAGGSGGSHRAPAKQRPVRAGTR